MKNIVLYFLSLSLSSVLVAQDFKVLAAKEIEHENYAKAVSYLERAVAVNPNDAQAWYTLGHCIHWLCYDSVPLADYDRNASDRIMDCMQRALTLDPKLRDCYSVIGSEYGLRAEVELQSGHFSGFIDQLRRARKAGGYPDWLLEYGRNILNSCEPNAILLTGGDAEVFPIWYCQFIDSVRTDVTLAPVPLLDRTWFVLLIKSGINSFFRPVPLAWTRSQIMEMHVSKWTEQTIELPVPPEAQRRFGTADSLFQWILPPDLQRDDRTLLSVNRTIILGLLKANNWRRPVHFSLGCQQWMFANLNDHFQLHGMTYELVPFSISANGKKINIEASAGFLRNPGNFRRLVTLKDQDIPFISPPLNNYRMVYGLTCDSLLHRGDFKTARLLVGAMDESLPESVLPMPAGAKKYFDDLRQRTNTADH